jgi:hypothetical protein
MKLLFSWGDQSPHLDQLLSRGRPYCDSPTGRMARSRLALPRY